MATSTTSSACSLLIPTLNSMITYTTPTQQAMARIATAPVTSDQGRPTPTASTRLALAACPMPRRCPEPCQTCTAVARSVAGELGQVLRERHGGSSSVADWLDGFTHTGDE
jgi:hypothetical protein